MRKLIALLIFTGIADFVISQESTPEFKPSGKPLIKVFANYHSIFADKKTYNAFEIERAYLGYAFDLNKEISAKVGLDVLSTKDKSGMKAYLKNAYLKYTKKGLEIKFGLYGRKQFKMQEKLWGGRYLYKSFMAKHKFGSSADFGTFIKYKIHKMLSIDAAIENGEGYKHRELDSVFKYSSGLTITPLEGLNIRLYTDYMKKKAAQKTYATYIGYKHGNFRIGGEYNYQANNKYNTSHDFWGYSFYTSYSFKKIRIFGRFDLLESNTIKGDTNAWNYKKDGKGILAGIEFKPMQRLKISPNYQAWLPDADISDRHAIYLNFEFKF